MKIKFWGVRGSIPTPLDSFEIEKKIKEVAKQVFENRKNASFNLQKHLKELPFSLKNTYGGNTACIELRTKSGQLILIDAGSGIRNCGLSLLSDDFGKGKGYAIVLISHTHFDHIYGWPFFAPSYISGNKFDIYGPMHIEGGKSLRNAFADHMNYSYFPVYLSQLGADIKFYDIGKTTFNIGKVKISSHPLNHTCMVLGYKIKEGDKTITYQSDSEPYYNPLEGTTDEEVDKLVKQRNDEIVEFAKNSDILIADTQYTPEEYSPNKFGKTGAGKIGWGHSTYEHVIEEAKSAKVKKVVFFHYEPQHSDEKLEDNLKRAKSYAEKIGFKGEIILSYEGLEIEL